MFLDSYEKTDRRILGGATATLAVALFLLLNESLMDRLFTDKYDRLEQIGSVKISENDVQRSLKTSLAWDPLHRSNDVYQGDSIFTGDNSNAVVVTDKGEEIVIAENSFVVINAREDSITLDIGFGSVEGKVESGKKLLIATDNQVTELTGTDALVKIDAGDGGRLIVNVLDGQVTSKTEQGTKTLGSGEATEIDTKGSIKSKSEFQIDLVGPSNNQKVKPKEGNQVDFIWESKQAIQEARIQISKDPSFKELVFSAKAPDFRYTIPELPKDQTLYWKVLGENVKSTTAPFVVVGDRAPIPIYPKAGTHIYYDQSVTRDKKAVDIELSWEEGSPADRFQVQLASDESFERIIKNITSQGKKTLTGLLTKGEYYWRVRSVDFPNETWSDVSFFNVSDSPMQQIAPPTQVLTQRFRINTKPHRLSTREIFELPRDQAFKYMKNIPTLSWRSSPNAEAYLIEISKSRNFQAALISEEVSEPYFIWKEAQPGKYYWRLQTVGPKYTQGVFSAAQSFTVEMAPPVSLAKKLVIEQIPDLSVLNSPPPPYQLKWRPSLFTKNYELLFSSDKDFRQTFRFITQENTKLVQARTPGIYYWKVRAIGRSGRPISNFSKIYTYEFKRTYSDPEKMKNLKALKPAQQETIVLVGQGDGKIEFLWSNPFKGSPYRIEMSYTPDFSKIFHSELVKKNRYTLRAQGQNGTIYWRVRAENKLFRSPWTGANRFQVASESKAFDFNMSDRLFQARLRARERQRILAELIRLRKTKDRSPAATVDVQLETPVVKAPINNFTLVSKIPLTTTWRDLSRQPFEKFFNQHSGYPLLTWEKVPQAERYVVEIARDREFKKTLVRYPTVNNQMLWDTIRPGQFYWRVQAFNDNYIRSRYSITNPLYVTTQSPVALSPDIFLEVMDEPKTQWLPPSPFRLEWTPVVFARKYEVEFANDVTFSNKKVFKTEKNFHKFKVSRSGTYFWRVRPINQNGVGVGPYSPIRALEVAQANRTPASVNEVTGVFPAGNRTLVYVGQGFMKLLFHWLSPHEGGEYQLELSTKADFSDVIVRKTTYHNKLEFNKPLPNGPIFWRVGFGKSGFIQEWSETYKFNFRKENKPYLMESISAE